MVKTITAMTHDTNIPQGYKATALGIIPQEWKIKYICDVGIVKTGSTPSTKDKSNFGLDYMFVTPADISDEKYITDTERKLSYKGFSISRKIPQGSILFTCIGIIGKIAIASNDLTSNQQINAIICNDIHNEYLYYELLGRRNIIKSLAGEQVLPMIKKSDFEKIKIIVPPVEEQRKIAEILGVWDKAIELQARLIDKLELRKRALMQRLLSGRHRLPGFSAPWQKVKLSEAGRFLSSNTLSRDKLNHDNGTFQNIHYGDILIHYPAIVNPDIEIIPYINEDTTISSDILKNGDVIFADTAEDNTAGKAIEIINAGTRKITAGLHTIAFRPNNGMFAIPFLGYYINSTDYQQQLEPLIQGIKVCSISKSAIKGTYLQVPSLAEQAAIAEVLSTGDKEIKLAKAKLAAYRTQKRGLMQQLLTGKKRVK